MGQCLSDSNAPKYDPYQQHVKKAPAEQRQQPQQHQSRSIPIPPSDEDTLTPAYERPAPSTHQAAVRPPPISSKTRRSSDEDTLTPSYERPRTRSSTKSRRSSDGLKALSNQRQSFEQASSHHRSASPEDQDGPSFMPPPPSPEPYQQRDMDAKKAYHKKQYSPPTKTTTTTTRRTVVQQEQRLQKAAAPSLQNFHRTYTRGKDLGYGAFAQVYVGIHNTTNKRYAIKQIDRTKMHWGDRDALHDEIHNLQELREGPNIVHLLEIYEEPKDCYLVMELLEGGELFDRILQKKTFTEKEARDVCKCMLSALQYMHSRRIAHRDLKPENLLLQTKHSDTELKLADFGFAKKMNSMNAGRTLCGTPGYLAPEILERFPAYDVKCDLWSVGVILFLLLGGYLPFDAETEDEVFEKTRNGLYHFLPNYWTPVSASAKHLVTSLLTVNPQKRTSAAIALSHPWMQRSDADLRRKKLSVQHLQQSIMTMDTHHNTGKAQFKKAVNTVMVTDRMRKLNDDFESYLAKRSDSVSVFSVASKPVPKQVTEDSAKGLPFKHFYNVGDVLGEGGFGVVKRCEHKKRGDVVAVKIVDRTKLADIGGRQALQDEIAALKLLRGGPHIVRLFDVFKEKRYTYIVMEEMAGGELLRRIVDKETYTEREARSVCKILFSAVDYCHKKKIAHRDLKPENLLLTDINDDTSIKIADFGFAKRVTKPNCLSTLCGTASYVAPEVLDLTSKGYDQRADMWSVGVIVYILLGGYAPFEGPVEELANLILRGEYEFHDKYWVHTSTSAKDLISSCLQVNPHLRITAEEALQSDWMTAEEETLIANDLSEAQEQIRKTLPIDKFKAAVHTVMLTNKLTSLGNSFTSTLGDAVEIEQRQKNRGANRPSMKHGTLNSGVIQDSSSGKPFHELYELGMALGTGSFSVVHEAVHKQTNEEYAIKRVDLRTLHPADAVALQDEISALKIVADCPQIVKLIDVFDEPDTSYIVLERMYGGDLIERIIKKKHYTEADAKAVCKNLLLGVQFCHKKKIANRNLKPENLLLVSETSDVDVKICDFGYAKKVLFPNSLRTQCGTEGYVAPEILAHRPAYDVLCDMWSLGVIMYIVVGGYRPFRGTPDEVMKKIRYGEYEFHDRYWHNVSNEAKDLIRRMMTVEPNARISASEALRSPWIMADDSTLQSDLSGSQRELKSFKAKAKVRQVVQAMIAMHKLQNLGKHYRNFEDF